MDTPVDTPMDAEPMDPEVADAPVEAAPVEARGDEDAMPHFEVPDTAEELSDDFLAAPPEPDVDPDVAAIFDAVAGDEFAFADRAPALTPPEARAEAGIADPPDFDIDFDLDDADAGGDAETETEPAPHAAAEADAAAAPEPDPDSDALPEACTSAAGEDADEPLVNLPDPHDPDLEARIDELVAGFQVRLDELIADLHAE